jgi:hypothetical protein
MIKKHKEILPDLNCAQVQDATVKIQSAYRGFKTRKELKESGEDLPDLKAADVAKATIKIQAAYKGFKTRQMVKKHKEVLPDLNCAQVQDATIKIQSAYRGFKTRKELKESGEELPDLKAADVAAATIKIQSAYKGFRVRKEIKQQEELRLMKEKEQKRRQMSVGKTQKVVQKVKEEPKESATSFFGRFMSSGTKEQAQVKAHAEIKKEVPEKKSIFGFFGRASSQKEIVVEKKPDVAVKSDTGTSKTKMAIDGRRQQPIKSNDRPDIRDKKTLDKSQSPSLNKGIVIEEKNDEMPDLQSAQVQDATLKIQSAYRGFKTRKDLQDSGQDLPNLKAKDVVAATIKIQAAYKGFKTRQMVSKQKEEMPDLNCAQVQDAAIKIQSAYRGFKTRKDINIHPELRATVGATLKIQAYYRGFKVRKAIRDQEARQAQAHANVTEASMKLRVLPTERSKKTLKKHTKDTNAII